MERISRETLNIEIAQLFSKRSTCERLQVGAVIVKEGRIIATGYNGSAKGDDHCTVACDKTKPCTRAIHAEANAIYFAARHGVALEGCTLYCTHSPCIKCAEAIVQAGITNVLYLETYRDTTALAYLIKLNVGVYEIEI